MLEIKNAKFITSIASEEKINEFNISEIAFAGRSNVGKSSCINYICNNYKLAKVSSTCGKTRLLNFFSINNNEFHIVDLPGYGYARVSDEQKEKWATLIENYLKKSKNLKHVFVLVDIRHEPNENDINLINFLNYYRVSFSIIATKSDKLSKQKQLNMKQKIANKLNLGRDNIVLISSLNKTGKESVLKKIEEILYINEDFCD